MIRSLLTLSILQLSVFGLLGCAGTTPQAPEKAFNDTEVKNDSFRNETWVETKLYVSRQGFTDTFPVSLKYRAKFTGRDLAFIQLGVIKSGTNWGFYDGANGEDGYAFEFTKIDGQVGVVANTVYTDETFGLLVPRTYLNKMATRDWRIKVYGKRDEGVFVVPKSLTVGFIQKLECFEANSC